MEIVCRRSDGKASIIRSLCRSLPPEDPLYDGIRTQSEPRLSLPAIPHLTNTGSTVETSDCISGQQDVRHAISGAISSSLRPALRNGSDGRLTTYEEVAEQVVALLMRGLQP
jgi:hypothetical protein